MKKLPNIVFIITATIIIIYNGCKDKVTTPPEEQKPPGYQEDIPWPSLANSPWPVDHADPQRTGRSKFNGPSIGILEKIVTTPELQSGIVVGLDSTIYVTSSYVYGGLIAYYTDGTVKWKYNSSHCWTTPIVAKEGTIYYRDAFTVYAINSDGKKKWEYDTKVTGGAAIRPFTIGKDGTIYYLDSQFYITAINSDGTKKWSIKDSRFYPSFLNEFAFSPDGKTIYTTGYNEGVLAFDIETKSIKWTFEKSTGNSTTPVVDSKGNIYINSKDDSGKINFCSLTEDRKIRWKYPLPKQTYYGATIDKNGNIYIANDTLYSLDYSGNLRWKLSLDGHIIDCALTSDVNGNIFVGLWNKLIAVSNSGKILWTVMLTNANGISTSPAIVEGAIYIPSNNHKDFYIVK